jgi:hypothetical protein
MQATVHQHIREQLHDRRVLGGTEEPVGILPDRERDVESAHGVKHCAARQQCHRRLAGK